MKMKKAREVTLRHVAEFLPVNIYFNKFEFAELTGVSLTCTLQRLRDLVNDGFLHRKGNRGQLAHWLMTHDDKRKMMIRAIENEKNRGKRRQAKLSICDFVENIIEAERQAYYQSASMHLSSVKFI